MKITEKTLGILKNFTNINSSFIFKKGDKIKTCCTNMHIVASAIVDEEFPKECHIYDLNKFLNACSLFDEPNLEFQDEYVIISDTNKKIKYIYSHPTVVKVPQGSIPPQDILATVSVSDKELISLNEVGRVMGLTDIAIIGTKDKIQVGAFKKDDTSVGDYDVTLDGQSANKDFNITFSLNNLKMMKGNYTINISEKVAHFINNDTNLEYWIGIEQNNRTF